MAKNSELWDELSKSLFGSIDDAFLTNFRESGGANNRLAAWDPFDRSARYFKFLLFNISQNKPPEFFDYYKQLRSIDIGNPMSINMRGCKINIDYLFSIEEFLFLKSSININSLNHIVEIGAGFGRTCHAMVLFAPNLKKYTIVDLPEVLQLSRKYLQKVITKEKYNLINFIDKNNYDEWSGIKSDIVINIDSFQEMPREVIFSYIENIIKNSKYFYSKNPIGKYHPKNVGIDENDISKFHDVFSLGLCQDIIDIFNEDVLLRARQKYNEKYKPGPNWKVISQSPLEIFPYLHNALFMNMDR